MNRVLTKPERSLRPAVGWMLGPELIARLGSIVDRRNDPRDWMTVPLGHWHDESTRTATGRYVAAEEPSASEEGEVWFDFISDIGDSSEAMYAVACACLSSFETSADISKLPPEGARSLQARVGAASSSPHRVTRLPRGQFLFIGGDTAYHVGDEATIRARVQEPFTWAHADLGVPLSERVRLYGIPGNHDWYDDLDGFGKLLQRSTSADLSIELPGFERVQQASYVGIKLPFGWQLWGLDIDGGLDARQQLYFQSLCLGSPCQLETPHKLILCTPSPTIVFSHVHVRPHHAESLKALHIPVAHEPGAELPDGRSRLELAGDIHHYARYQEHERVCSVVSGLGGAFHHPSFTKVGRRKPAALFPSPDESLNAITPGLLSFRSLIAGSYIRIILALMALLLGLASLASGGAGWLLSKHTGLLPTHAVFLEHAGAQVWKAFLLLLVLVAAARLTVFAVRHFRATELAQSEDPTLKRSVTEASFGFGPGQLFHHYRSQWLSMLVVAVVVFGLIWFGHFSGCAPRASVAALDVIAWVLGLGLPLGGAAAGWWLAAPKGVGTTRRVAITLAGFVHGSLQLVATLLCARLVPASVESGEGLYKWASPLAGLGVLALSWALLCASRSLFRRRWVGLLISLALATWSLLPVALVLAAPAEFCAPHGWPGWVAFGWGCVLAGALCPLYFAWYLAVVGLLDGHNNEVGGASRVTEFRQMVRVCVSAQGVRGYAIAIRQQKGEQPALGRGELSFELIDVFDVRS